LHTIAFALTNEDEKTRPSSKMQEMLSPDSKDSPANVIEKPAAPLKISDGNTFVISGRTKIEIAYDPIHSFG